MPNAVIRNRCKVEAINDGGREGKIAPARDWLSGSRKRSWWALLGRAVCIRVNCISIDPVFISICREFMCELSGKEHGVRKREGENGGAFLGRGVAESGGGKVARFTRVVSRRPLANYNSICISSNKSRHSSHLCRHTRRVFPWILHLLTSQRGGELIANSSDILLPI